MVQRFGLHVDYLLKVLADAGLKPSDVTINYVNDLTGKNLPTPSAALLTDGNVASILG